MFRSQLFFLDIDPLFLMRSPDRTSFLGGEEQLQSSSRKMTTVMTGK
jgi:hypothetical protein